MGPIAGRGSVTRLVVLMSGLILFAVSLRGGGPYSLDRRLGWTL